MIMPAKFKEMISVHGKKRGKSDCCSAVSQWSFCAEQPDIPSSGRLSGLFRPDPRPEDMILPDPINLQVGFGIAFFLKTKAAQEVNARLVARQAARLQPVQLQRLEGKHRHQRRRLAHIALS